LTRNINVFYATFCALTLLLTSFASPVRAGDFLLFPSVTTTHQTEPDTELVPKTVVPAVDFFYSSEFDKTRFLGEFLKSSQEAELERLQFGWRILPGKTLWFGRFHNALSFWNTQMHHGDFLQTSLSRPTVSNYEDEHGPLPAHITGLELESSRTVGDSEINYIAGFGIGPFFDTTLEPFDLLDPDFTGAYSGSVRLGYHPEAGNPNQYGVAIGYASIPFKVAVTDPVSQTLVDKVQQTVLSAFLNYERADFHLIGELFIFDDRVSGAGNSSQYTTVSGYLQPEYKLGASGRTIFYGRIEATPDAANDGYLSLLPEFSPHQGVVGLRYELTPTQAIKFEAGRTIRQDTLSFNSISAQWSMVLPL
jgi:hypothetical protein